MGNKIKFEKSDKPHYKYEAILPDGKVVHFGDTRYQQYEDKTPLKLYKHLDHHDKHRRELYYKRHPTDYPTSSADDFSKNIYGEINNFICF